MFGKKNYFVIIGSLATAAVIVTGATESIWGGILLAFVVVFFAAARYLFFRKNLDHRVLSGYAKPVSKGECFLNFEKADQTFDDETINFEKIKKSSNSQEQKKMLKILKKSFKKQPVNPWIIAGLGWCESQLAVLAVRHKYAERHWAFAFSLYAQADAVAPGDPAILSDWGRALDDRAGFETEKEYASAWLNRAVEKYASAASSGKTSPAVMRNLGWAFYRLSRLTEEPSEVAALLRKSAKSFQKACSQAEWGSAFYNEMGLVFFELAGHSGPKAARFFGYAAQKCEKAVKKADNDPSSFRSLGIACYMSAIRQPVASRKDQLLKKAMSAFEKAISLNSDQTDNYVMLARCWQENYLLPENLGEGAQALHQAAEKLSEAAHKTPDSHIFFDWGQVLVLLARAANPADVDLWAAAAEKYESAANFCRDDEDLSSSIWHNWGYVLTHLSELEQTEAGRREILAETAQKFSMAIKANPESAISWLSLGETLMSQGRLWLDEQKSLDCILAAADKFKKVAELEPHNALGWQKWGSAVMVRARLEDDGEIKRNLWFRSTSKLEKAVKLEPGNAVLWVIWGQALQEQAQEYESQGKDNLLLEAIKKYEKALTLDGTDDQIYGLLGQVMLELAFIDDRLELEALAVSGDGDDDEPEAIFEEIEAADDPAIPRLWKAAGHFSKAARLNPENVAHWLNWGRAHLELALRPKEPSSGLSDVIDAYDKYKTALALDPENCETHNIMGKVLYQWANCLKKPELMKGKLLEAYGHCRQASRLSPHNHIYWQNWGHVIKVLADLEDDLQKSEALLAEAVEKEHQCEALEKPAVHFTLH